MNRVGLFCALTIAVVMGLIFGLYPELDLRVAGYSYSIENANHDTFALRFSPSVGASTQRRAMDSGGAGGYGGRRTCGQTDIAAPQTLDAGTRGRFPDCNHDFAPWLMANVTLKEYWARPRPIAVVQFGGNEPFVPWWDPRGDCTANCSFVSGEVTEAFCISRQMSSLRAFSPISLFGSRTPSSIAGRARGCQTVISTARSVASLRPSIISFHDCSDENERQNKARGDDSRQPLCVAIL